jgi:hypothetical protein
LDDRSGSVSGLDGMRFFTETKCATSRWFTEADKKQKKVDTWEGTVIRLTGHRAITADRRLIRARLALGETMVSQDAIALPRMYDRHSFLRREACPLYAVPLSDLRGGSHPLPGTLYTPLSMGHG